MDILMNKNVPLHIFDENNLIETLEKMLVLNSNWIHLGWNNQNGTVLKMASTFKLQKK